MRKLRASVRSFILRLRRRLVGEHEAFASGLARLLFSATASRVVALAATPLLTRIYSPELFGVSAVFISVVLVILPVATLRLDLAIPIADSQEDANDVAKLAIRMAAAICTSMAILVLVFWQVAERQLAPQLLGPFALFVPFAVFICAILEVAQGLAIRRMALKLLASAQIFQAIAGTAVKLVLGLLSPTALSLVIGQVFQQAGGILVLIKGLGRTEKGQSGLASPNRSVAALLSEYRDFPLVRMPSQLLQVLAAKSPIVLVAGMFGAYEAGQFGLAFSMLALPVMLIGQSAGNAFYAQIAPYGRSGAALILSATLRLVLWLALLSAMPAILLGIYGSNVFEVVFGADWAQAGRYCEAMSIYLFFQIVAGPLMHVFTVLRSSAHVFGIAALRLVATLATFYFAQQLGYSPTEAVGLFSIVMALYYAGVVIYIICLLRRLSANAGTS